MLEKCAWKAYSSILLSLQLLDNCNNSCVSGRIAPQSPPSRASKSKMLYYFPGWLCHQGGSTSLGRGRMDIRQNPLCAGNGAMHRSCSSRSSSTCWEGREQRMHISLPGRGLPWQQEMEQDISQQQALPPPPGAARNMQRSKEEKIRLPNAEVGGNAEENAAPAHWKKWVELFHMGITPTEKQPRGGERSCTCIRSLTYLFKKQSPCCHVGSGSQLG